MTKPFFSQVRSFAPQKAVKSEGRGDRLDSFTLIELMVVLALIGIMTALIIPQMKGTYQDAVLRSTGRQLVDVLSLAGSRAITLSQPMRVYIEPRKSHYFVQKGGPARQKSTAEVDFPGGEGEINKQIRVAIRKLAEEPAEAGESGPAFVSGDDLGKSKDETIAFYPDGTADAAEIILRDRDGFGLALQINPVTARINVVELERERK